MDEGVLRFYDRETGLQTEWELPTRLKRRIVQALRLSPDGTELWFQERASMSLRRYRLPD